MTPVAVNPPALGPGVGYAQGMRAGGLLFVSGQVGAEPGPGGRPAVVSREFVPQFDRALHNVLEVVRAAGAPATSIVEMTVFVTDLALYRESRRALGEAWRRHLGRHYPAMTLVEVKGLLEPGALVEIRAVAALG